MPTLAAKQDAALHRAASDHVYSENQKARSDFGADVAAWQPTLVQQPLVNQSGDFKYLRSELCELMKKEIHNEVHRLKDELLLELTALIQKDLDRRCDQITCCLDVQNQSAHPPIGKAQTYIQSQSARNERRLDEIDAAYGELLSRLDRVEQFMLEDPVAEQRPSAVGKLSGGLGRRTLTTQNGCGRTTRLVVRCTLDSETVAAMQHTSGAGFPILTDVVNESFSQDLIYDFSETMWDIMPFCGLGLLTRGDQICVSLIAFLNVVAQGCFIGLVSTSMLENDFVDDSIVGTLEKWRVLYAHNPDFADTFTNEPLALSLCTKSLFMMHGASQASLYNTLVDYTQPFFKTPSGGVLCLLSVFLWILTCAKECKRIHMFFVGVWTSNDDSRSLWQCSYHHSFVQILDKPLTWIHGEVRQKNYQIFLTPLRAFSLTIVVILPRVVILVSLAIVGCFFLVQTLQLSELILNAVALDVVMNVDELLFDVFAPPAASRFIYKTMPLRIPRSQGIIKHFGPWFKLAVALICLTMVGWGLLAPMIETMNDVKVAMCDGDQKFLAVQLSFGPVVVVQASAVAVDRGSYKYRAIHQKTKLAAASDRQNLLYVEDGGYRLEGQFQVAKIKSWRDRSIKEVAELTAVDQQYTHCGDNAYASLFPEAKVAMMTGVGSLIGNEGMQSCADVAHLCYNDTSHAGQTARLVCPNTCGVSTPGRAFTDWAARSGLFLDTTEDGIPTACRYKVAMSLRKAPCVDFSLGELLNGSAWKNWADGVSAFMTPRFMAMSTVNNTLNKTHFNLLRNFLLDGMPTHGCNFFKKFTLFPMLPAGFTAVYFCNPEAVALQGRRSIRLLCPVTCGCNTHVKNHYQNLYGAGRFSVVDESQCPEKCFQ